MQYGDITERLSMKISNCTSFGLAEVCALLSAYCLLMLSTTNGSTLQKQLLTV